MFQIFYTKEASDRLAHIEHFDPKSARQIFDHIQKLPLVFRNDPFLQGSTFQGLRRNRSGRFRIIYRVLEREKRIHVITIDYRKSAYNQ